MRIVGGTLRGRRIAGPRTAGLRPTSERAREGIASALAARGAIDGARVLDLFAGTGALAFEAISRGATSALCIDSDRRAVRAIQGAAVKLDIAARVRAVAADLEGEPAAVARRVRAIAPEPFDLLFADPPWERIEALPPLLLALAGAGVLAPEALLVLEHAVRRPPPATPGLETEASYRYGDTAVQLVRVRR